MRKKINRSILMLSLIIAPFIYAIYLYPNLPNTIPTHFNLYGEADQWGSKESIFLLPIILGGVSLFVYLLISNINIVSPKQFIHNDQLLFKNLALYIVVFMTCLTLVITYGTVHKDLSITQLILGLLALGFIGLGIYMPKLKQNYFAGFRLPWTLENEDNWNYTHKIAGKYWVIGGVMQTIAAVVLKGKMLFIIFMSTMAVMVIVPIVYSFLFFKNGKK